MADNNLLTHIGLHDNVTNSHRYATSSGTITVSDNPDGSHIVTNTNGMQTTIAHEEMITLMGGAVNIGEPLTAEERKKLDNLKKEKQKWIRDEKLKNFKNLPAHIRQEIVDEACVAECINNIDDIDESKFDEQDQIDALERKDQLSNFNNGQWFSSTSYIGPTHAKIDIGASYERHHTIFKYGGIIGEFTKDELMNAHSEATLEENLED